MITPNEIRSKAEKRYNDYLQSAIQGLPFTDIVIKGNKKPSTNFSDFDQELTKLIEHSKEKKEY